MIHTLSNKYLTVRSKKEGAELTSIVCNKTNKEYLWQGDPKFWGRHSPVLFPIVGSLWDGKFKHNNREYKMSQHGFARDMTFNRVRESDSDVLYRLVSSYDTLDKYPFPFILDLGYKLVDNQIEVIWEVKNFGSTKMHFQIGAHPAFNYPDFDEKTRERGYFSFEKKDVSYKLIGEKGCLAVDSSYKMEMEDGLLPLDTDTFNKDALVIEDRQIKKVSLLDKNKKNYLSLHFETPVVGLWSPPNKNAPFVCIEPWYGRCDRENYMGEFRSRDWVNHLDPGETFRASYFIEIGGI